MSVDKVRSFQRGCHTNGKLKSSPPHSHLQFQDSALSPTLALLPANRAGEASVAEYSLFQKSDAEFLPLSACPDFSAGHESDEGSLSQRPLAQESATSDGEPTFTPQKVHAVGEAADVGHIASGSRDTRPDAASELLYRQLLSQSNKSTAETSKGETSAPRSRRDGAEESYLGFLPQSQSTPGFLELPSSKSAVTSRTLSVIPSSDERSQQVHDGNPSSEVLLSSNATANSKVGASLLASSSVVSSEVENYAPYWTSKPTSPAQQADLNIEERIPLYLQNLGIDQSPADILTPFAPRGPIREPEFSPTDLSTIKDSPGGTPTKSSEAGSPPKGELTDSAASLPSSRDSLPGATRRPAALPNPRSAESSTPRARSSPFAVRSSSGSEKAAEGSACVSSSAKLTVAPPAVEIGDTASPRRAEPEGCSAAPHSPIAVGPPPAADAREPASLHAHPSDASDEEVSLPDGLVPVPEDPEDRSVMSDGSGRSSLTVRVAELLRGGSPGAGVSDRDLPKHKKSFILKLSEGHFDSLELDKEDRRRIEEIKAAMLSNNFVTSESSTDTETTAASGASRPLSDLAGAWTPVLPGAEPIYLDAREIAGVDVKAHTSITIAARKRPAAASLLPPEPLLHAQLDAGFVRKNPAAGKSSEEEGGSQNATHADSAGRPEETSRRRHVAEDSTIPFAQVSRAHLTLSPKPPERAPRASTSSSSSLSTSRLTAEPAAHGFVPLSRSSPAVSGTDEGVGPSGPPPQWDGRGWPASALAPPSTPPPHHHHHQSVTGSSMRSYTPETPVRDDECAARAPPPALRPYKPRGASELFFLPHAEADASSSCTTVESSHTGLDDAVPPQFPAEVLGQTDPGLDRGVTIKHAEGIYSKKRANALPRSGGAVASDERFPQASQRDASALERLRSGGGVTREADRWPLASSDREAWLLEQLRRLSDLILTTGGADAPLARTDYDQTRARTRQPHASACVLCPADRDESSATSSTLDTDRLVRAFGARRVLSAKTPKSAARLHKLYGEVAKQRAQWEGRSFNTPPPSDTTVTETSNATGSSSSTGSSYTATPQPRTSKKPLSRGLQAVDVEIVCNATRLRTRDVGTMFPPAGRAVKGHVSSLKHKKTRAPPKLPKAVWWFVPLDDDSKENRPEEEAALEGLQEPDEPEAPEPGPSTVWYDDAAAKTAREPLGSRQVDDDIVHLASSKSGHQVPSLQEALATRRADFISRSRRRVQILRGRKMNGGRLPGGGVPRRAVPWKEMIQRTKRMYERLPEVLRKLEADRREAQNQLNQLNLQIYNKRITKRRLDNRNAVRHEKLW